MAYFLAIDPGANSALALVLETQAWGFRCSVPEELEKAFEVLRAISKGSIGSPGVIAIESVHSMPTFGHQRNFQFGKNTGFWHGILTFLNLPYIEVTPMVWQTAVTRKPARPDVKGMSKSEVNRCKREHKAALKEESIRAATKAFPRGIFPSHDVADAVNIARYLKLTYPEGTTDMKIMKPKQPVCGEKCTTGKKLKVLKSKPTSKGKVVNAGKKAGVSSKGAVKVKDKMLHGGTY